MRPVLLEFMKCMERERIGQFRAIIVHIDGKLWDEHFQAPRIPYNIHSVSKSFMSTAVGFAVDEGLLKLDDKVVDAFPDLLPEKVCDRLGTLTLRHLLMMSSGGVKASQTNNHLKFGHYENTDWIEQYLRQPFEADPGTRFWYQSGDTYMAAVMLQKKTGMTMVEYLQSRLFDPLQIETPYWAVSPAGYNIGWTGLWLKTEDMIKWAELFRNKGKWQGRQLISPEWVADATAKHIATDDNDFNYGHEALGYGYQIWQCLDGGFRGSGLGGQHTIALPKYNATIAVSAYDVPKMHKVLELVWDIIVPELK